MGLIPKPIPTDTESGYYVKGERTKQFAYSIHAAQTVMICVEDDSSTAK